MNEVGMSWKLQVAYSCWQYFQIHSTNCPLGNWNKCQVAPTQLRSFVGTWTSGRLPDINQCSLVKRSGANNFLIISWHIEVSHLDHFPQLLKVAAADAGPNKQPSKLDMPKSHDSPELWLVSGALIAGHGFVACSGFCRNNTHPVHLLKNVAILERRRLQSSSNFCFSEAKPSCLRGAAKIGSIIYEWNQWQKICIRAHTMPLCLPIAEAAWSPPVQLLSPVTLLLYDGSLPAARQAPPGSWSHESWSWKRKSSFPPILSERWGMF